MSTVVCGSCQASLPSGAQYCPSCGASTIAASIGATQRLGPPGELACLRCGGEMEQGFTVEPAGDGRQRQRSRWVVGTPQIDMRGNFSTSGRRSLRVRVFRCVRCGYLESYARDDDHGPL